MRPVCFRAAATALVALIALICAAGCGAPADPPRTASPYLHTNVIDRIAFRPADALADLNHDQPPREREPVVITVKDDIRTIVFWLNETFHNRPVADSLDDALVAKNIRPGQIKIDTAYGQIQLQVYLDGAFEPMKTYTEMRLLRSEFQTMVDDRYPEEVFFYVDTVVVEYQGLFYKTYFFPRPLTRPMSSRPDQPPDSAPQPAP